MARRIGLRPLNLKRVEQLLARERKDQRDFYARLSSTRVDISNSLAPLPDRYRLTVSQPQGRLELGLSPTSLRQLCSVAGVPVQFMEKVPASLGLSLMRGMMEMAGETAGRQYLFRIKEGPTPRLRAILPQGYVRFDDRQILTAVKNAVTGERPRVVSFNVTEDTCFFRMLLGESLNLGTRGSPDPGRAGLDVISSETGCRPLEIRHVVFRLVCSNGITSVSRAQAALKSHYTRLDRPAFERVFRKTLGSAMNEGRNMAGRLAETRSNSIDDPKEEIKRLFRRYRLGSSRGKLAGWVGDEVVKRLNLFGVQQFDLIQAFTAVARGLDHSNRMRVEDAMGAYLMEGAGRN